MSTAWLIICIAVIALVFGLATEWLHIETTWPFVVAMFAIGVLLGRIFKWHDQVNRWKD